MTTTEFRSLAAEVAATLGLPEARIVEVAHPLGGVDASGVERRADSAVEETIRVLTS
ncbi:MAG: hypothetical protein OXN44_07835 [Acidimicrobiaceae bacterium]|nr:hypothetical protein [Acidimicrobiaceae bacterium]MDE0607662.1 hypothetical protein [Acidimicrobiaceae bacterium]